MKTVIRLQFICRAGKRAARLFWISRLENLQERKLKGTPEGDKCRESRRMPLLLL
jgi:hypothetical protein